MTSYIYYEPDVYFYGVVTADGLHLWLFKVFLQSQLNSLFNITTHILAFLSAFSACIFIRRGHESRARLLKEQTTASQQPAHLFAPQHVPHQCERMTKYKFAMRCTGLMKTDSYGELRWMLQGARCTRSACYARDSVKMRSKAAGKRGVTAYLSKQVRCLKHIFK